jgi:hypothetical protein
LFFSVLCAIPLSFVPSFSHTPWLQDYVKTSSNIALSPILDTFDVHEVLNIVHKCIVNQKCGRIVNMHPIGDMCPFLITDKHYLTENLLCLMSNGEWRDDGRSEV